MHCHSIKVIFLGGMESTRAGIRIRAENKAGSIIISLEKTKTNITFLTNV